MVATLNGDLSLSIAVDTQTMDWTPSPSGHVLRKRVHLVGDPESGQVTSVVEYLPGARFPPHDHPQGEEILVLEGVFSDEHGHWPAGTYLLHPEGFHHGPFSDPGCTLFVKLRQYPGVDRQHIALQTNDLVWEASDHPDRQTKPLYQQMGFTDRVRLEKWSPHTTEQTLSYAQGAELFVLQGSLEWVGVNYGQGSWLRFPLASTVPLGSREGCELYIKEGGFPYLHNAPDAG